MCGYTSVPLTDYVLVLHVYLRSARLRIAYCHTTSYHSSVLNLLTLYSNFTV